MRTSILTSMFPNGFTKEFANQLQIIIDKRGLFVFVASEFERSHEKTDEYFDFFLNMFTNCNIVFENCCVIDGRMTKEDAQKTVRSADVIWLAGGDTPTQYEYLKKYGLDSIIKNHNGVIIGMSAGAINMAKTAICSQTCGHDVKKIYEALGLVDISVEPHLDKKSVSNELLEISQEYPIYGLCDDGAIIYTKENITLLGDIFLIYKGNVKQIFNFSPMSDM